MKEKGIKFYTSISKETGRIIYESPSSGTHRTAAEVEVYSCVEAWIAFPPLSLAVE